MHFSRRHFFFGSLALPALAAKKPAPDRPNILLLVADNLPKWVLGAYGNKEIRTPSLDRLARVGVKMMDNFTASPSAAHGRASLLSGAAPMQPGPAIETVLTPAGYTCQSVDAAGAVPHIDKAAPGKPFFLTVNLTSPKPPYDVPAQKYRDLYAQTRFDTFNPEPAAANARSGKAMFTDIIGNLRKYAAAVSALDDEVGAILTQLIQKKIHDQTMVIFTSSCGALLSHHGLWDAGEASEPVNMFDEAVGTPMILAWPLRLPPATTRPEVVSAYDLAPTLYDLLSIESKPAALCGRSYALIASGKPLPKGERWQPAVFARLGNTWMARGERYKLVTREGGPGELYDTQVDPAEKTNQFDNGQFTAVKTNLANALAAWRQKNKA
jgi:arylsulfatase A-like enzyme